MKTPQELADIYWEKVWTGKRPKSGKKFFTEGFVRGYNVGRIDESLCQASKNLQYQSVPSGWISAKDRKPEGDGLVLVYTDDGQFTFGRVVAEGYWEALWVGGEWMRRKVTHWMPFPLAPENTNDE